MLTGLSAGDTLPDAGGVRGGRHRRAQRDPGGRNRDQGPRREPAIIAGKLRVAGSNHVTFERVHFAQDVMVEHSDTIRFANIVFLGPGTSLTAAHSVDTRVTPSSFTGFANAAISLPGSAGASGR